MERKFNEEVYKVASIAVAMMPATQPAEEPSWDEVAFWAVKLLGACEKALAALEGKSEHEPG